MRKGHASKHGSWSRKSDTTRYKKGKIEGVEACTTNVQRFLLILDGLYSGLEVGMFDRSCTHRVNDARKKHEKGNKGLVVDENGVGNVGSGLYRRW